MKRFNSGSHLEAADRFSWQGCQALRYRMRFEGSKAAHAFVTGEPRDIRHVVGYRSGAMNDSPSNESPSTNPSLAGDPSEIPPESSAVSDAEPTKELTPEEQMALYEEDLKETDWGHQPC